MDGQSDKEDEIGLENRRLHEMIVGLRNEVTVLKKQVTELSLQLFTATQN